jgi:hypothetical protein
VRYNPFMFTFMKQANQPVLLYKWDVYTHERGERKKVLCAQAPFIIFCAAIVVIDILQCGNGKEKTLGLQKINEKSKARKNKLIVTNQYTLPKNNYYVSNVIKQKVLCKYRVIIDDCPIAVGVGGVIGCAS